MAVNITKALLTPHGGFSTLKNTLEASKASQKHGFTKSHVNGVLIKTTIDWIRNLGLDVDHHLPKDGEESEPPKFMKMVMKYSPVEIPEEYLTKKFLIDLAATWIIYEFIIAPVKWPYYFIATRYAVKVTSAFDSLSLIF